MARDNVPEDVFIFAVARLLECPVYLLEATVLTDVETLLKGLGFVGREWDRTRSESNGCVGDLSRVLQLLPPLFIFVALPVIPVRNPKTAGMRRSEKEDACSSLLNKHSSRVFGPSHPSARPSRSSWSHSATC